MPPPDFWSDEMKKQLSRRVSQRTLAAALSAWTVASACAVAAPAVKAATVAGDTGIVQADNPCGPSNPCGPGKKKKKKDSGNPCGPSK